MNFVFYLQSICRIAINVYGQHAHLPLCQTLIYDINKSSKGHAIGNHTIECESVQSVWCLYGADCTLSRPLKKIYLDPLSDGLLKYRIVWACDVDRCEVNEA